MYALVGWFLALASLAHSGSWKQIWGTDAAQVPAQYPIRAYSEFLPPPKVGGRPYEWRLDHSSALEKSAAVRRFYRPDRPSEFQISAFDEIRQLQPGLTQLTKQWLKSTAPQGPVSALFSVSLTQTQDDKGMTPWTVLGAAEGQPEEEFWRSAWQRLSFGAWFCGFLTQGKVISEPCSTVEDLKRLGVRVAAQTPLALPSVKPLAPQKGEVFQVLLTFLPESAWRPEWRQAYRSGKLTIVPHPSTLEWSRGPLMSRLAKGRTDGWQIPLAEAFSRASDISGLRVPRAGMLPRNETPSPWRRPSRFSRMALYSPVDPAEKPLSLFRLIFDPSPDVTELYGKPSARNTQIWGTKGKYEGLWVLDGPSADKASIRLARETLLAADATDEFAYRESFPPMEFNGYAAHWRRPVAAWYDPSSNSGTVDLAALGRVELSKGSQQIWLAAALDNRWGIERDLALFFVDKGPEEMSDATAQNVRKILEFSEMAGSRLPAETAAVLVTPSESPAPFDFAEWRHQVAARSRLVGATLDNSIDDSIRVRTPVTQTFAATVGDSFENTYWDKIVALSEGLYRDKNNVDCTAPSLNDRCRRNHLPVLADDYFTPYYRSLGLTANYHAFAWITDFDWQIHFDPARPWWGGLGLNLPTRPLSDIAKDGHKNVVIVVPGQNHDEAIVMADHYDTAYMDDIYTQKGLRHASKGADDNHSATATLMEAARVLKGKNLKRDVWLVHLTGEEFPSDCLGARALSEALITGTPVIAGKPNPKIVGLYVLDMVGHSTDRDHDPKAPSVFQISTGRGARAARLGQIAHEVTTLWNRSVPTWNAKFKRTANWERIVLPQSGTSDAIPRPRHAVFPEFRGEIRPGWHTKSALYNTDGIVFSDAGIPTVLLMENYDIGRSGYHDSQDTVENLDLDYAAGMARIAIESVAQAAME